MQHQEPLGESVCLGPHSDERQDRQDRPTCQIGDTGVVNVAVALPAHSEPLNHAASVSVRL